MESMHFGGMQKWLLPRVRLHIHLWYLHSQVLFACDRPMHEDEVFSQYRARMEREMRQRRQKQARENEASGREVTATFRPCPNCNARLDKWTGRDHVTCESHSRHCYPEIVTTQR